MPNNLNEKEYLESLIRDFPPLELINVDDDLLNLIDFRYENFGNIILEGYRFKEYSFMIHPMVLISHEFLFNNIFNNAGRIRRSTDKGGGFVGFGGPDPRCSNKIKFFGSPTDKIEEGLEKAYLCLDINSDNPLKNALIFYQKFVKVHPFYDGNGRIARFVVNFYLRHFELALSWQLVNYNGKRFLHKLNAMHKREDSEGYNFYLNLLIEYCRNYLINLAEINY